MISKTSVLGDGGWCGWVIMGGLGIINTILIKLINLSIQH